tara:strand:- start:249 stop:914 length:666 start_codon:yes stop_codon:yes gene_type:complete
MDSINSIKNNIDLHSINLEQGKELHKYENIYMKDAIPHLQNLQATANNKVEHLNIDNNKYLKIDNYQKINNFTSYSKNKDIFNKSVSEYMLAKEYYINTNDENLKDKLINLTKTIIKTANSIKNSLDSLFVNDEKIKNNIEYEKKQISLIIDSLEMRENKSIIDNNSKDLLKKWYRISIFSFFIMIFIILLNNTFTNNEYITISFFIIISIIIVWFRKHII